MNKGDCENIGHILSSYSASEEVLEQFFRLDPRIKEDYDEFQSCSMRRERIDERMLEILKNKFGHKFGLLKACGALEYKKAREQAECENP